MVKVYFENKGNAENIATFESEEVYLACLPILTIIAEEQGKIVTESIE